MTLNLSLTSNLIHSSCVSGNYTSEIRCLMVPLIRKEEMIMDHCGPIITTFNGSFQCSLVIYLCQVIVKGITFDKFYHCFTRLIDDFVVLF
jgi:hypothetical protein